MAVHVYVEPTPNPLTRKFVFDGEVVGAPFEVARQAASGPLEALFAAGAESVFVGSGYVSVTVCDDDAWAASTIDAMRGAIADAAADIAVNLSAFAPPSIARQAETDPVIATIIELLETRVRPAVAHDGGDISFHSFEKGILKLNMSGACSGCPSSTATLKMGIRNLMTYFVPEVLGVEAA